MSLSKSSDIHINHPSKHVRFDLHRPKSFYKGLFQETELGQALKRMFLSKAIQEAPKHVECECGIRGKNSNIHYIPEQEAIQEALE